MISWLHRYPDIAFAIAAALVFVAWPGLDLWLAGLFYVPGHGFSLWQGWWVHLTYVLVARFWVLAPLLAVLLVCASARRAPARWRAQRSANGYLLAVLLIGPGLITNTLLKNEWGRPRPVHLVAFGGHSPFVPALQPSGECATNCAFVSGHAAAAFFPIAGFWITRRRRYLVGGIVFGLFVGFVRMAMGAHFLSDVLFAGVVVALTCRLFAPLFLRGNRKFRCRHFQESQHAAVTCHSRHE